MVNIDKDDDNKTIVENIQTAVQSFSEKRVNKEHNNIMGGFMVEAKVRATSIGHALWLLDWPEGETGKMPIDWYRQTDAYRQRYEEHAAKAVSLGARIMAKFTQHVQDSEK